MSDTLQEAQSTLGRALERALAGEDRALAQQVRDAGEQLVRLLTGLLRLLRTHAADNRAFDNPLRDASATLVRLVDLLGPLNLVCVEGQIYLNDIRVRMDERGGGAADLTAELRRHGCGGLGFGAALDVAGVRRLIGVVGAPEAAERPLATLQGALREARLDDMTAHGLYRIRVTGEAESRGGGGDGPAVSDTLRRAAQVVGEAWDSLVDGRAPNPLPVRRLVNDLVDSVDESVRLLEAEENGPTFNSPAHARHSLRVSTLSILIGKEIGLSNAALADLGVAAMFHDTGYTAREDGFAPPFERHGTAAARLLLKQRGFHPAKVKRLLVALEHHRALDRTPSLYSRIVRVADDFDTLTRHRPTGALLGPYHALRKMTAEVGILYDTRILQAFANRVGCYPPGTLLRLADGRWVVSVSGVRSPETFEQPLCRLVREADGSPAEGTSTVDLAVEGTVARVIPVR